MPDPKIGTLAEEEQKLKDLLKKVDDMAWDHGFRDFNMATTPGFEDFIDFRDRNNPLQKRVQQLSAAAPEAGIGGLQVIDAATGEKTSLTNYHSNFSDKLKDSYQAAHRLMQAPNFSLTSDAWKEQTEKMEGLIKQYASTVNTLNPPLQTALLQTQDALLATLNNNETKLTAEQETQRTNLKTQLEAAKKVEGELKPLLTEVESKQQALQTHQVTLKAEEDKKRKAEDDLKDKETPTDAELQQQLGDSQDKKTAKEQEIKDTQAKIAALPATADPKEKQKLEVFKADYEKELKSIDGRITKINDQMADRAKPGFAAEVQTLKDAITASEQSLAGLKTTQTTLQGELKDAQDKLDQKVQEYPSNLQAGLQKLAQERIDALKATNPVAGTPEATQLQALQQGLTANQGQAQKQEALLKEVNGLKENNNKKMNEDLAGHMNWIRDKLQSEKKKDDRNNKIKQLEGFFLSRKASIRGWGDEGYYPARDTPKYQSNAIHYHSVGNKKFSQYAPERSYYSPDGMTLYLGKEKQRDGSMALTCHSGTDDPKGAFSEIMFLHRNGMTEWRCADHSDKFKGIRNSDSLLSPGQQKWLEGAANTAYDITLKAAVPQTPQEAKDQNLLNKYIVVKEKEPAGDPKGKNVSNLYYIDNAGEKQCIGNASSVLPTSWSIMNRVMTGSWFKSVTTRVPVNNSVEQTSKIFFTINQQQKMEDFVKASTCRKEGKDQNGVDIWVPKDFTQKIKHEGKDVWVPASFDPAKDKYDPKNPPKSAHNMLVTNENGEVLGIKNQSIGRVSDGMTAMVERQLNEKLVSNKNGARMIADINYINGLNNIHHRAMELERQAVQQKQPQAEMSKQQQQQQQQPQATGSTQPSPPPATSTPATPPAPPPATSTPATPPAPPPATSTPATPPASNLSGSTQPSVPPPPSVPPATSLSSGSSSTQPQPSTPPAASLSGTSPSTSATSTPASGTSPSTSTTSTAAAASTQATVAAAAAGKTRDPDIQEKFKNLASRSKDDSDLGKSASQQPSGSKDDSSVNRGPNR